MTDPHGIFSGAGKASMGHFGQIKSIDDLPPDTQLKAYIKEAARLNEQNLKVPRAISPKRQLSVPDDFKKALARNTKALKTFESFTPSNKREYVEWVTEAKTEETRKKRLSTSIEWMAEGKARNWKYMKR